MATTNLGLDEVALSNTFGQLVEMLNGNMETLDGLPLPIEYGENNTMKYLKLSNGKVVMWGRIAHGTKYPCSSLSLGNYASSLVTVDFPIALANNTPTVLATPQGFGWADLFWLTKNVTYTTLSGYYLCPNNDSGVSGGNSKVLNLLVIGDWK